MKACVTVGMMASSGPPRAFASATTTGPFSTNQAGFDAIRNNLKPEESDTYELGKIAWRLRLWRWSLPRASAHRGLSSLG